jgi:hypothetical protein
VNFIDQTDLPTITHSTHQTRRCRLLHREKRAIKISVTYPPARAGLDVALGGSVVALRPERLASILVPTQHAILQFFIEHMHKIWPAPDTKFCTQARNCNSDGQVQKCESKVNEIKLGR